jgi:CRISPR-associated protein Cmr3
MSKVLKIRALDTLFFRDGKPFTMGSETFAQGIFPPLPSTIYGALRTAYFAQNMEDFALANKANDPTKTLFIKGIYFHLENDFYFPAPVDLVELKEKSKRQKKKEKRENRYETHLLRGIEQKDFFSSNPLPLQLSFSKRFESIEKGLIQKFAFEDYLNGDIKEYDVRKIENMTYAEHKVGISRNDQIRSSEEGNLYRLAMTRLVKKEKELMLYVEFGFSDKDKIEAKRKEDSIQKGLIRLGGEGKMIAFTDQVNLDTELSLSDVSGKYFKLYLLSPAIFENGNRPDAALIFKDSGIEVALIAAMTGKAFRVGGFNMQEKRPKTMSIAFPAGSVYYYKIMKGGTVQQVIDFLATKMSISSRRKAEGFGLFKIATFNYEDILL